MTEKELRQLYYLCRETDELQRELQRLEWSIYPRSQEITGMPSGTDIGDIVGRHAAEMADLRTMIELNIQRIFYERRRIERFIEGIADAEIRLIVRLRFINHLNWDVIGAELGMERTTVSKKCRRFLKRKNFSLAQRKSIG